MLFFHSNYPHPPTTQEYQIDKYQKKRTLGADLLVFPHIQKGDIRENTQATHMHIYRRNDAARSRPLSATE